MSKKEDKRRRLRERVVRLADEADTATMGHLHNLKTSIHSHQIKNVEHKKTNPRSKGGINKNNKKEASSVVKNTNEYVKAKKKSDMAKARAKKYFKDHRGKEFPDIEKTSQKALNDVSLTGMLNKMREQGKVKEEAKGENKNIPISVSTGEPEGASLGANQQELQGQSFKGNVEVSTYQPAKELDAPADIANSTPVVPKTTTASTDPDEVTREGGGTAEQLDVGGFGAREDKYERIKKHNTKLRDPALPPQPLKSLRGGKVEVAVGADGGTEPVAPAPVASPGMSPDERDAQAEALRTKMMGYIHHHEHTTAEAQTASQTAQAPPIPATPQADPAMQPTADTTGQVNILQAEDTAGIPTTSKELFSGVGKESTTEGKSITQLKDDIKYFHSIYDKFIPEFNSTSHKKKREEALKTKNIALVKIHYNEMEASIRKFYQDQSGLKLGVVISAESYIKQFLSQQSSPWPQPAQPAQPIPPVVDEPVNAPTGEIPTQPTGVRQAEGAYNTEGGDRVYRKTGDPYDYKTQEQQILATQGGLNRAAQRGMGQLLHAPPLKMATGYMGDSVLRQDDRTGFNRFLNTRVINRFPSNFKIKG